MKYQRTILVSSVADFSGIKPVQWVQIETGSRGQYLGKTQAGVDVIRWQDGKFCQNNPNEVFNNRWLRKFALSSKA